MSKFIVVAKAEEILPGQCHTVEVEGKQITVFNVDGNYYALDDNCIHRGGPLGQGNLEENTITCPWHAWKFDVITGTCLTNPMAKVASYQTKLEGTNVLISF